MRFIKWFYMSLGNSKSQRFTRFMLILIIIAAVICYGFHSGNLQIGVDPVSSGR